MSEMTLNFCKTVFTFIAQNYEKFICKCKLFVVLLHNFSEEQQTVDDTATMVHMEESRRTFRLADIHGRYKKYRSYR